MNTTSFPVSKYEIEFRLGIKRKILFNLKRPFQRLSIKTHDEKAFCPRLILGSVVDVCNTVQKITFRCYANECSRVGLLIS